MEDSFSRNETQARESQDGSRRLVTPNTLGRSRENHTQQQHFDQEKSMLTGEQVATFIPNINVENNLDRCILFVKLMFTNPMRLNKRATRYTVAEAKVLGKMAKVWYIKKKIKKLGKKLKKHTIAVPVLTAIPIYEHSYYPQHPHIPQNHHQALQHAAAASVYVPSHVAQIAQTPSPISTSNSNGQQALATAASNTHHQLANYRVPPHPHPQPHHHQPHPAMYHPMPAASAHQIINSYAPSPPLYVDDTGALYGTYGNAYGRYDGGYQYW